MYFLCSKRAMSKVLPIQGTSFYWSRHPDLEKAAMCSVLDLHVSLIGIFPVAFIWIYLPFAF